MGSGEWGVGSGGWGVTRDLTKATPHSPSPTPHSNSQSSFLSPKLLIIVIFGGLPMGKKGVFSNFGWGFLRVGVPVMGLVGGVRSRK